MELNCAHRISQILLSYISFSAVLRDMNLSIFSNQQRSRPCSHALDCKTFLFDDLSKTMKTDSTEECGMTVLNPTIKVLRHTTAFKQETCIKKRKPYAHSISEVLKK